jgi:hypothetical protein
MEMKSFNVEILTPCRSRHHYHAFSKTILDKLHCRDALLMAKMEGCSLRETSPYSNKFFGLQARHQHPSFSTPILPCAERPQRQKIPILWYPRSGVLDKVVRRTDNSNYSTQSTNCQVHPRWLKSASPQDTKYSVALRATTKLTQITSVIDINHSILSHLFLALIHKESWSRRRF